MLFNSFTYLLFLPLVVLLYWVLPVFFRRPILLVASYIFYMNWMPAYGLLILALTVVNYFLGRAIARFETRRKAILVAGLIFNLGCLCFYKYANFLLDSIWQACTWLHQTGLQIPVAASSPALNIILPLGISFFTFEFIHYIVDVYRGSEPVKNFWHFALFAAFFPSQIAGPIKRFQDFMKQLTEQPVFKSELFKAGLFLIFLGLFKKVVLSDNLGEVVAAGFGHPERMGTLDAWIAIAGFTIQIFLDFSGYTDIGRGSALLFGYKVPENFNWPFLSSNLTEFWRRWHISLSTWLRDYLFIPMGGSRVSKWKQQRNLFITMVLGGLWHGAAWHYVIWGAFHGSGLVATKLWQDFVSQVPALAKLRPHPVWHYSGVAVTMFFLLLAGVLFRSENIPHALNMAHHLFMSGDPGEVTRTFLHSTLPITFSLYMLYLIYCMDRDERARRADVTAVPNTVLLGLSRWWESSIPAHVVVYTALSVLILGFAPSHVEPFIYFQF
jgi:alginate O-acetyltransferase complex protein AlgI